VPVTTPTSDAMDVDGDHQNNICCYNCNKFGLIAHNCPEPKRHCSIRTAEITEAVHAILAEKKDEKKDEKEEAKV
jgi:hypothetical protein